MTRLSVLFLSAFAAMPVLAEEKRQLDAHEHGVGALDIAFDGAQVAISLHAPGADIVGFEHAAKSPEDRAAVDAAVAVLARPLDLFVMPEAAACSVLQASAELEGDHHGHDHGDSAEHTEFHADYMLTCGDPTAISGITFAYFEAFPNARELEIQIISGTGATAFEVERDTPTLDLRTLFGT